MSGLSLGQMGPGLAAGSLLGIGIALLMACSQDPAPPDSPTRAGPPPGRAECPAWSDPSDPGTSVILIVADTLRADHLSLYGYERPTSPVLENWARRGAVFERAYASSPWTLPSFASIHTGQSPSTHAAGLLVPETGDDSQREAGRMVIHGETKLFASLDPDSSTLAEILCSAGYATAAVVNNPFLHPIFGIDRGFEHYDYDAGDDATMRRADEMVDRALAWISDHAGAPFFLLLHLFDPHMNYDAPEPHRGRFSGVTGSGWALPVHDTPRLRSTARNVKPVDRRFIEAAYDEEIAFMDAQLGRFMNRLERRGITGNSLVVFTADHGEELFDHESFGHGHTLFEEQLRVPLLLIGTGVERGHYSIPVSIIDVAPTILDALGMEPPQAMEGVSLWDVATGVARPPVRLIYAERRGSGPEHKAVIQWPYKLIVEAGTGERRLYDLVADPAEQHDLEERRPQLFSLLGASLEERFRLDEGRTSVPGAQLDIETLQRLRALGYLE